MIKHILTISLAVALAACKVTVIVPRGGEVQSTASGTCAELTNCVHDVKDTSYAESFTAVPNWGFQFIRWNTGGNFHCKDSTNKTCAIDITPVAGIIPDEVIAGLGDYYIMPIFSEIKEPITDTVIANGKTWAQPRLFHSLQWNAMDAVCPSAGGGVCNGVLNQWDMKGWVWASVDDVNALFNSYGVSPALGPGPDEIVTPCGEPPAWAVAFWAGGWEPTAEVYKLLGWTRTENGVSHAYMGFITSADSATDCEAATLVSPGSIYTNFLITKGEASSSVGGFFYRVP